MSQPRRLRARKPSCVQTMQRNRLALARTASRDRAGFAPAQASIGSGSRSTNFERSVLAWRGSTRRRTRRGGSRRRRLRRCARQEPRKRHQRRKRKEGNDRRGRRQPQRIVRRVLQRKADKKPDPAKDDEPGDGPSCKEHAPSSSRAPGTFASHRGRRVVRDVECAITVCSVHEAERQQRKRLRIGFMVYVGLAVLLALALAAVFLWAIGHVVSGFD